MDAIQTIYIALFGRPADPLGLAYWDEVTTGGADLSAIGDLANEAEYQDRFVGMSGAEVITSIYNSLFGRNPEQAGLTYFLEELNSGRQNINTIAINIAQGAKGVDAEILANKVEAANLFTDAIDTADEIAGYRGDTAADKGRAFLSTVTADKATIPTEAQVDAAIADLGEKFDFTAPSRGPNGADGIDNLVGGAASDTFNASDRNSLNSADSADGGAGRDVLNIAEGAFRSGAAPTIKNIEVINNSNVNGDSPILDLSNVTGVEQVWTKLDAVVGATSSWSTYANGSINTTYGISGAGVGVVSAGINLNFSASELAGSDTTLKIALSGNDSTSRVGAGSTTESPAGNLDSRIEHAVVDSAKGNAGLLNFGADELKSITITGEGNLTISSDSGSKVELFDASASTGNVSWAPVVLAAESVEVLGGAGNDVFNLSAAAGDASLTIDLGAGNDTLTLSGATAATVTLGAGSDTVTITNLSNISDASEAKFMDGLISITDFTTASGGDVLSLAGLGSLKGLINTQVTAIAEADSLFDAIGLAAGYAGTAAVAFDFGGNAYIFDNANGAGFNNGDGLIELAGVSVADLGAANLVFGA